MGGGIGASFAERLGIGMAEVRAEGSQNTETGPNMEDQNKEGSTGEREDSSATFVSQISEESAKPGTRAVEAGAPRIEPITITYELGKTVEIPVIEGNAKIFSVYVKNNYAPWLNTDPEGTLPFYVSAGQYNAEKGVISLWMGDLMGTIITLQKGDYPVEIGLRCKSDSGNWIDYQIKDAVKIRVEQDSRHPFWKYAKYTADGSTDLVYQYENGTGCFAIEKITAVEFYNPSFEGELYMYDDTGYTWYADAENRTLTLNGDRLKRYMDNAKDWDFDGVVFGVNAYGEMAQGGQIVLESNPWRVDDGDDLWNDPSRYEGGFFTYVRNPRTAEGMPKMISQKDTFDGTKDLVFHFVNGTGDYEIKKILKLTLWADNSVEEGALESVYIASDELPVPVGVDVYKFGEDEYVPDIANGKVTWMAYTLSAMVYGSGYSFSNPYHVVMLCEFANGERGYVYPSEGSRWSVEFKAMSPAAVLRHQEKAGEGDKIAKDRLQELVKINAEKDLVIGTKSGLSYVFKKGTFKPVADKEVYDFSAALITDFTSSGIQNKDVSKDDFAVRVNYTHSGPLPGTAEISIPVDSKWNGKTLYYYQIMTDGSLADTGVSAVAANGRCKVTQDHCSDYVLLAKAPEKQKVQEVGAGATAGGNGKQASPKTGDQNGILFFVLLSVCACLMGGLALRARRRA